MAERIQRQRTKGWRMPEGAVYVGRPSRWGNPYRVGNRYMTSPTLDPARVWTSRPVGTYGHGIEVVRLANAATAIAWYREWVEFLLAGEYPDDLRLWDLRGHDLACWCPLDQPCHADVLLELANA